MYVRSNLVGLVFLHTFWHLLLMLMLVMMLMLIDVLVIKDPGTRGEDLAAAPQQKKANNKFPYE